MAKFGKMEAYTGTGADVDKERRSAEWQRAFMLAPQQAEAVQATMLANPYDREASTRMELLNEAAKAMRVPPQQQAAIATQAFGASPQTVRGKAMRPMQASPRAAQQSASPIGTNDAGQLYPTAGNYVNGNFQNAMMRLGLDAGDDSGDLAASLQYNAVDPTQRYKSNMDLQAAQVKAQGQMGATAMKLQQQQALQAQRNAAARTKEEAAGLKATQRDAATQAKDYGKAADDLGALKAAQEKAPEKAYGEYAKQYQSILKQYNAMQREATRTGQTLDASELQAMLDSAGLGYSVNPKTKNVNPLSKGDPSFAAPQDLDMYAPGSAAAMQRNAATRTPGGSRAVAEMANQDYLSGRLGPVAPVAAPRAMQQQGAAPLTPVPPVPQQQAAPSIPPETIQQDTQRLGNLLLKTPGDKQQFLTQMLNSAPDEASKQRLLAAARAMGFVLNDHILATQIGQR